MIKTLTICIALLLFICSGTYAVEKVPDESGRKLTAWQAIGLGGFLSAALAGIAAYEPLGTGVIYVCVPPYMGGHGAFRVKHVWPVMIAFTGLGVYNLTVDEEHVSRTKIFGVNFLAMSAAMIASSLLYDPDQLKNKPEDRLQAGLSFGRNAGMLTLSYAF